MPLRDPPSERVWHPALGGSQEKRAGWAPETAPVLLPVLDCAFARTEVPDKFFLGTYAPCDGWLARRGFLGCEPYVGSFQRRLSHRRVPGGR